MNEKLEQFIDLIKDFDSLSDSAKSDYFAYFLQVVERYTFFTGTDINNCFNDLDLHKFARMGAYLSENSRKRGTKKPKFIKQKRGYTLERYFLAELAKSISETERKIKTSVSLKELLGKISGEAEKNFLNEAVDCYKVGANRAAIIMVWLLALDHLCNYILRHKLSEFNIALSRNTDKRVRVIEVRARDDFTDIPEKRFIELCREARIISSNIKDILETKLKIRNSSAHPAGIKVSPVKAEEFIDDLVENVILKYKL